MLDIPIIIFMSRFKNILFQEPFDVLNQWMRGHLSSEDVVEQLGKELRFNPEVLLKELIVSCQNMRFISEDSLHLIANIRSMGVKVIIATDNMDAFRRWTVPSLSIENSFDAILCSYELCALKTDTDDQGRSLFFRPYMEAHAMAHGESLLLDDSGERCGKIIRHTGIDYEQVETGHIDAALRHFIDLRQ